MRTKCLQGLALMLAFEEALALGAEEEAGGIAVDVKIVVCRLSRQYRGNRQTEVDRPHNQIVSHRHTHRGNTPRGYRGLRGNSLKNKVASSARGVLPCRAN